MTYWHNKVAVVTGGSAGLGFEIAKALVARNAKVALVARDQGCLVQARDKLGQNASIFSADITKQSDVDQLQANVAAQLGRVNALINCAGKSTRGEVLKTTPEEFQQLFDLNFLGLVRCTQAFMPMLVESRGHVVNIGSLAAKSVSRYLGAYPASKFPVAAYSHQLRLELVSKACMYCWLALGRSLGPTRANATMERTFQKQRNPGGGIKLKGLDPAKLAARILLGCERRELEVILPRKAKVLFVLSQISPRLGDWLISRFTR